MTSINKKRSVLIIQFLRSVIKINERFSPSINESLDNYFKNRMLKKSHENAEQVSKTALNELSDYFSYLKEFFRA